MSLEAIESCYDAAIDWRQAAEPSRLALSASVHAPAPPVLSRCRMSIANTSHDGQLDWIFKS